MWRGTIFPRSGWQTALKTRTVPLARRGVVTVQSKEKKDEALDFERQVLNPERTETCKTGTDDEVGHHKASYDPSMTAPEREYLADEEECRLEGRGHHPLFVSPANVEVSHLLNPMVGGAVHGADREGPSGMGWTRKNKKVHVKAVPGSEYEKYEKVLKGLRKVRNSESRQ